MILEFRKKEPPRGLEWKMATGQKMSYSDSQSVHQKTSDEIDHDHKPQQNRRDKIDETKDDWGGGGCVCGNGWVVGGSKNDSMSSKHTPKRNIEAYF